MTREVDAVILKGPCGFTDANLLTGACRAMILVEDCLDMFRRGVMEWGYVSGAEVEAKTRFALELSTPIPKRPPSTPVEVDLGRTNIDPQGVWLQGKVS